MDRLQEIFAKQNELFKRFSPIEVSNGIGYALVENKPFDINCRFWQALFKEQAWRITEEVFECLDAITAGQRGDDKEEAIDVLHFVVELFIKAQRLPSEPVGQIGPDKLLRLYNAAPVTFIAKNAALQLMGELGMTMNKLKNKPWKQSHKETDAVAFYRGLDQVFLCTLALCKAVDMSADEIFMTYMGKADKNNQRINSGE